MYTWYLKIYLNSGNIIKGYVKSDLKDSQEVANDLFAGDKNTSMGITSMTGGNLFYLLGSIEAFEIDDKPFDHDKAIK